MARSDSEEDRIQAREALVRLNGELSNFRGLFDAVLTQLRIDSERQSEEFKAVKEALGARLLAQETRADAVDADLNQAKGRRSVYLLLSGLFGGSVIGLIGFLAKIVMGLASQVQ